MTEVSNKDSIKPTASGRPDRQKARSFSKRMVLINCFLAWAAVFLSIVYLQAAYVAASGMTLVAVLGGAYMGVGHLDFKRLLLSASQPPPEGDQTQ